MALPRNNSGPFYVVRNLRYGRYTLAGSFVWLISCLCACGLAGGTSSQAPEPPMIRQFHRQLAATCETSADYVKEVRDRADVAAAAEEQRFAAWQIPQGDTTACGLETELMYVFDRFYQDPFIRDYFDEEMRGDTLVARLRAGKESASDLRLQKFVFSPGDSLLVYAESLLEKDHWLFDLRTHVRVSFDEDGSYRSHTMELYERTAFLRKPFHVLIQGKKAP